MYQCNVKDLSANLNSEKLSFTLAWQIHQRLRENFHWPMRTSPSDALSKLYLFLQDKVKNATRYCVICDKQLDYVGLKPAVCDQPLCVYSHMQYGLGEDIMSFIQFNPEVTDLLICLTVAAAQGDTKRFQPFPAGVEARICMHFLRPLSHVLV